MTELESNKSTPFVSCKEVKEYLSELSAVLSNISDNINNYIDVMDAKNE